MLGETVRKGSCVQSGYAGPRRGQSRLMICTCWIMWPCCSIVSNVLLDLHVNCHTVAIVVVAVLHNPSTKSTLVPLTQKTKQKNLLPHHTGLKANFIQFQHTKWEDFAIFFISCHKLNMFLVLAFRRDQIRSYNTGCWILCWMFFIHFQKLNMSNKNAISWNLIASSHCLDIVTSDICLQMEWPHVINLEVVILQYFVFFMLNQSLNDVYHNV